MLTPYFLYKGVGLGAVACLVMAWLAFLRFYGQRRKCTQLAYAYALLAHKKVVGAADSAGEKGPA